MQGQLGVLKSTANYKPSVLSWLAFLHCRTEVVVLLSPLLPWGLLLRGVNEDSISVVGCECPHWFTSS